MIVRIYHGRGYDLRTDTFLDTKRPAREQALQRLNLQVLQDRVYEVDEAALDRDGFLKPELMAGLREDSAPG
ncbi:MAG TPA: hypothetical protein VMF03_08695 [Steroidobacteraceae bacterium]|nr:hypothetical protein [Steroidobacteraceae bacterium]